ncbi:hypothetical protein [Arcanobacterium hippocoleae]|uniref:Spermidine/putrescine-binding protein n=1 Tax=Arcanobacterium hippocoleae TaxID=149017 RepID=A0ABU1T2E4_9ACTO|nr:hypothetical protein [Arcanobacterium hippocoleae]MDR6939508.1 spermidine/putrescine-binding protein [Arcanobacterium hippocoleae]
MTKKSLAKYLAVITVAALSFAALPAFAIRASEYGVAAYTFGRTVSVQDISEDGNSVYALYKRAGIKTVYTLYNSSGVGTTVSKTDATTINALKACVDDWFTDTCSKWKY